MQGMTAETHVKRKNENRSEKTVTKKKKKQTTQTLEFSQSLYTGNTWAILKHEQVFYFSSDTNILHPLCLLLRRKKKEA